MLQGATAFDLGRVPISIRGMGAAGYVPPTECEQYGSIPPPGCPGYKAPGSTTDTGSFWDKANNFLTKNSGAITDIASLFTKKPAAGGGGIPDPTPKSNTMKYVLIGGGVLAVTGLTIWAIKAGSKTKKK